MSKPLVELVEQVYESEGIGAYEDLIEALAAWMSTEDQEVFCAKWRLALSIRYSDKWSEDPSECGPHCNPSHEEYDV
jgi:hypothetical protein